MPNTVHFVLQGAMKWFNNISLRWEGNLFIKLRGPKKIQLITIQIISISDFKLISTYIFIISNILLILNTKLKRALHMLKNRKFHLDSLTCKTPLLSWDEPCYQKMPG